MGIVRSAYRPDQHVQLTTLAQMADAQVDMLSTIIIGNSQTRRFAQTMVTPRGYLDALPHSPLEGEGPGEGN